MIFNYIIALVLAPLLAVLLVTIIWTKRDKNRYPKLLSSFFYGMLSLVVVLLFQFIARQFDLENFTNIRRIIFYSFVVMGFGSELGKYLILRYHLFPKESFKGPLDSIVYSSMISLGFAFMGNILYFLLPNYPEIDFLYAITVVFANLFFAVILGFFVGLAKSRENKFVDSMTALFGAAIFHAVFNFCFITSDFRFLIFFSIGAFVIVVLLYYKAFELNEEFKRNG